MKRIHYYNVEIRISLFDYDNNPALSAKELYLQKSITLNRRFKTVAIAKAFIGSLIKATRNRKTFN